MTELYRVNAPSVVHEMIDDEVVIVHLESGRYYSLDTVGAGAWSLLAAHQPVSAVIEWTASHFEADREIIADGVRVFLAELTAEELLVPLVVGENGVVASPTLPAIVPGSRFVAPKLHKYTDMEELLLLDPIHEVDDTGWPRQE